MQVKLALFVSDKVPEIVMGDPGRFRQVITNLVGNSVKVSMRVLLVSPYYGKELCLKCYFCLNSPLCWSLMYLSLAPIAFLHQQNKKSMN